MNKLAAALLASIFHTIPSAHAGDTPGAGKAHLCTAYHDINGMKAAPGALPIGGRPADSLIATLDECQKTKKRGQTTFSARLI